MFLRPELLGILIPIIALLIPIVALLTRHQQKMAVILNKGESNNSEIANLRREIAELKALVHNQTIALDNVKSYSLQPPPVPSVEQRLN